MRVWWLSAIAIGVAAADTDSGVYPIWMRHRTGCAVSHMVKRSESSNPHIAWGLRTEYVVALGVRRSSCSSQLNWLRPSVLHHSLAPLDPSVPVPLDSCPPSSRSVFVRRGYSLMQRSFWWQAARGARSSSPPPSLEGGGRQTGQTARSERKR